MCNVFPDFFFNDTVALFDYNYVLIKLRQERLDILLRSIVVHTLEILEIK